VPNFLKPTNTALLAATVAITSTAVLTGPSAAADTNCPTKQTPVGNEISTPGHLQHLKETSSAWGSNWTQLVDIDMGNCVWDAGIGGSSGFTATYDGGGFAVTGLSIQVNSTGTDAYAGLFALLGSSGEIANVSYEGGTVAAAGTGSDQTYAGGLVGFNNGGAITNSGTTANVTATSAAGSAHVGGLVGFASGGTVARSFATGTATGTSSTGAFVYSGGLIGYNTGTVTNSYALGDTSATGATASVDAGGLIGFNFGGAITNSYATGTLTAQSPGAPFVRLGGLISFNTGGTVNASFFLDGSANNNIGTLKTPVELQDITTFNGSGWDIAANWSATGSPVWGICALANSGYPIINATYASDPCTRPSVAGSSSSPIFAIELITDGEGSCTSRRLTAVRGTWIQLPAATDCTAPSGRPDSSLLGWATTRDFPTDIAMRQVDNGWGAYERFSDDGRMTSVFIPGGGYTLLSNDGRVYAIWRG